MMFRAQMGVLVQPMKWLAVCAAAMATTVVAGWGRPDRLTLSRVSATWLAEHRRNHRYN
jgi:hypothetical protein